MCRVDSERSSDVSRRRRLERVRVVAGSYCSAVMSILFLYLFRT